MNSLLVSSIFSRASEARVDSMPSLENDVINEFTMPGIAGLGSDADDSDIDNNRVGSDLIAEAAVEVDVEVEAQATVVEDDGADSDGDGIPAAAAALALLEQLPDEDEQAEAPPRKRGGRPSKGASRTTTPAKTPAKAPRSAKAAATPSTASRKRKAADKPDSAPLPKRATHSRAAASKADAAIKEAANAHQRAPRGSKKDEKKPKGTRGRPKKAKADGKESSGEEYEVEAILDAGVDTDTKEHLYLVKWKGYGAGSNTWEPKKNLAHATELLKEFDNEKKASDGEAEAPRQPRKRTETKAPVKKAAAPRKAPVKKAAAKKATGTGRPRGRPRKA